MFQRAVETGNGPGVMLHSWSDFYGLLIGLRMGRMAGVRASGERARAGCKLNFAVAGCVGNPALRAIFSLADGWRVGTHPATG